MSVGRNDPCPCGSGRKYKVCHGGATTAQPATIDPVTASIQQVLKLLERGEHTQAQKICRQVLETRPEQAEARHYLGMALCAGGNLDAGMPHLRASLALRPMPPVEHNLAVFHNNLALWLEKASDLDGAEEHYKHALNIKPDYHQARFNLAKLLMQRHKNHLAKILLEELLSADPQNPELRGRLAEAHFWLKEFDSMEKEYRLLIARSPRPGHLHINLGSNLQDIGRFDDARTEFEAAHKLDPGNMAAITGIARIEELRNQLEESERWTEIGLKLAPKDPLLHLHMARLRRRQGRLTEAMEWLDGSAANLPKENANEAAREHGMILDKLKRIDEAFEAFRLANNLQRADFEERIGRTFYDKDRHRALFSTVKDFFTRERLAALTPHVPPVSEPAPVFIVGFPRSGTTLLEQMLTTHPHIHAGDEIQGIPLLKGYAAQQLSGSWKSYPECLAEVTEPGKQDGLFKLRDFYLNIASEQRAIDPDKPRFTDKMPLNEDALGLISLILPESPVIHVVRHPLDVILSCYFNQLTHGDNCALSLDTLAFHYKGIWDLVEHYVAEIPDLRYTRVRYEDLLADPEREMRRLFEFLGEEWEPRCLEFHKTKRVARTASYAQVNQPLYRSSQERWRPYRMHLEPIIPELKPLIEKLGYSVD